MKGKFLLRTYVNVEEMSKLEYCQSRGWELPSDEDGDERILRVTYEDGYVSMIPKARFFKYLRKKESIDE